MFFLVNKSKLKNTGFWSQTKFVLIQYLSFPRLLRVGKYHYLSDTVFSSSDENGNRVIALRVLVTTK